MRFPKLFSEDAKVETNLWEVTPDCYIDLRPFSFEMAQESYAYSTASEEIMVCPKTEILLHLGEYKKLGLVLANNILSSHFFIVPQEKDVADVISENFGVGCATDVFFIGEAGLDRMYVVNVIDAPSKRIVENQLAGILQEVSIVRALPASFATAYFIKSQREITGSCLTVECRPNEMSLYAWTVIEGSIVTLASDVVKTNVGAANVLTEKVVFMNHKVSRFFKTDVITKAFILSGETSIDGVPIKEIASLISLALKKAEVEAIEERFPALKGAWRFEKV